MNEENLRKRIRVLLDEIQNDADPVMLNSYRSIFRKEVSFFRRSYMAAYLLLLAEGEIHEKPAASDRTEKKENGRFRFGRKPRSSGDDARGDSQRTLSEEESAQLFISIGRNRKVFPREILALVTARAKISRDDVGAIRILDNYSFVQIRSSEAETVIGALNGHHFRGRTLTVNYARGRREGGDDEENLTGETLG